MTFCRETPGSSDSIWFTHNSVIVFDLRSSIVRKYWKNHICVINEALKCCHFYVNYIKAFSNIMILTHGESILCPTKSVGRSSGRLRFVYRYRYVFVVREI
jgi:hypothetical protein